MPVSGDSSRSPTICVPPVGDTNDQHDERIALHFIQHTVIADAKPPQATHFSLQCAAQEGSALRSSRLT